VHSSHTGAEKIITFSCFVAAVAAFVAVWIRVVESALCKATPGGKRLSVGDSGCLDGTIISLGVFLPSKFQWFMKKEHMAQC